MGEEFSPDSLFFQGVHECFAEHYPLALRPEVMLYLVTFNVATAIKSNPDDFRGLFTSKAEGKDAIEVRHDGLVRGNPNSPWHEVFPMFNGKLRERVPSGLMGTMLPDFSTRTPEVDAATMIAFMDAASPYYDYRVMTLCGIQKVRLLGTAADWAKVHASVGELAKVFSKHLPGYFESILPHLEQLAGQAAGAKPNVDLWKSIYKFNSASGGATFGGWLSDFLYYIQVGGVLVPRNPKSYEFGPWKGLKSGCAPSHVSTVPFTWDYLGTELKMRFAGGVLGLDNEDGYLTPALSYAVIEG
jgi:hypothetical protein